MRGLRVTGKAPGRHPGSSHGPETVILRRACSEPDGNQHRFSRSFEAEAAHTYMLGSRRPRLPAPAGPVRARACGGPQHGRDPAPAKRVEAGRMKGPPLLPAKGVRIGGRPARRSPARARALPHKTGAAAPGTCIVQAPPGPVRVPPGPGRPVKLGTGISAGSESGPRLGQKVAQRRRPKGRAAALNSSSHSVLRSGLWPVSL